MKHGCNYKAIIADFGDSKNEKSIYSRIGRLRSRQDQRSGKYNFGQEFNEKFRMQN